VCAKALGGRSAGLVLAGQTLTGRVSASSAALSEARRGAAERRPRGFLSGELDMARR
jgi:hypothetical protein